MPAAPTAFRLDVLLVGLQYDINRNRVSVKDVIVGVYIKGMAAVGIYQK